MAIAASAPSCATAFGRRSFHWKARFFGLTVVNARKVRRLMREHDLHPRRRRRRFVRTTDSDHDGPIHPFVANDFEVHGPDQLWGEADKRAFQWKDRPPNDLTYVAIAPGFAYVALIMDAWSRRVIGYAIGRRIDARRAVEALRRAIALRRPLPGCVFHSDRGSQYASEMHRDLLKEHGFVGSMSRRGNPCDNPQAESLMKTLKVEDVYLMEYETFEDVAAGVPPLRRRGGRVVAVPHPAPVAGRGLLRP